MWKCIHILCGNASIYDVEMRLNMMWKCVQILCGNASMYYEEMLSLYCVEVCPNIVWKCCLYIMWKWSKCCVEMHLYIMWICVNVIMLYMRWKAHVLCRKYLSFMSGAVHELRLLIYNLILVATHILIHWKISLLS